MIDKNKKEAFELYKIFNEKVSEESREFYTVNSIFFAIVSTLFVLQFYSLLDKGTEISQPPSLLIFFSVSIIGLIISIFWRKALRGQGLWKNFWANKLIDIETFISEKENVSKNNTIWQYLKKERKENYNWKKFKDDCVKEENILENIIDNNFDLDEERGGVWQELSVQPKKDKKGFGVTKYVKYVSEIFELTWGINAIFVGLYFIRIILSSDCQFILFLLFLLLLLLLSLLLIVFYFYLWKKKKDTK